MDKSQASRFIKVVEEHGNKIASTQITMTILYEIATLPENERTKENITTKGGIFTCFTAQKKPINMV